MGNIMCITMRQTGSWKGVKVFQGPSDLELKLPNQIWVTDKYAEIP